MSEVRRDVLITGITAAATVATSLIAILPQLRRADAAQINDLTRKLHESGTQTGCELPVAAPRMNWTIRGTVMPARSRPGPAEYQVYLVPESYVKTTADNGSFTFEELLPGEYSIVVRELGQESSGTVRAPVNKFERGDRLESRGAILSYSVLPPRPDEAAAPEARRIVANAAQP